MKSTLYKAKKMDGLQFEFRNKGRWVPGQVVNQMDRFCFLKSVISRNPTWAEFLANETTLFSPDLVV